MIMMDQISKSKKGISSSTFFFSSLVLLLLVHRAGYCWKDKDKVAVDSPNVSSLSLRTHRITTTKYVFLMSMIEFPYISRTLWKTKEKEKCLNYLIYWLHLALINYSIQYSVYKISHNPIISSMLREYRRSVDSAQRRARDHVTCQQRSNSFERHEQETTNGFYRAWIS